MCGVEKLTGVLVLNCIDEQGVGDASDEITDALMAGERRHGFAECSLGLIACIEFVFTLFDFRLVGALPSLAATRNGRILKGWTLRFG